MRVLKRFKRFTKPKPKKRGPKPVYWKDKIITPLKRIWLAAYLPCSKRLKVMLPIWLPGYDQGFGKLSAEITQALRVISPAPIDRILAPTPIHYTKRGRATTKPGTLLRKHIPIKTNQWNESRPGFIETDTAAHWGDSTAGMYANTIDFVDIATGWTEQPQSGKKENPGFRNKSKPSKKDSPSQSSASIVITETENGGSSTISSAPL